MRIIPDCVFCIVQMSLASLSLSRSHQGRIMALINQIIAIYIGRILVCESQGFMG